MPDTVSTANNRPGATSVAPLRVLAALPNPNDLPPFDAPRTWQEMESALKPLAAQGRVLAERLVPATENELRKRLAAGPWHVLHFIGDSRSRQAAQYATLAWESSDGRARQMNAQYLATLLRTQAQVGLVVLQACAPAAGSLAGVAAVLLGQGISAVVTCGLLTGQAQSLLLVKLYHGLANGQTAEAAVADARQALLATGHSAHDLALVSSTPGLRLLASSQPGPTSNAVPGREATPSGPVEARSPGPALGTASLADNAAVQEAVRLELERKRAAGVFDVFLCHNSADKPAVKQIAVRLKARGILPWLDAWELPPGQPWQPLLEKQIATIKSAAVFVGAAGLGPWQEQEMNGFLRQFVARRNPVIPVLLPDAPAQPALPIFLESMTWVDFRADAQEALERLIWGITGKRPEY